MKYCQYRKDQRWYKSSENLIMNNLPENMHIYSGRDLTIHEDSIL